MAEKLLIRQKYSSSFILNESKLNRINEIILKRLLAISEENFITLKITINLEKSRTIYLTAFSEIFQQDNSLKNKIRSLQITYSIKSDERLRGDEVIALKFYDYREDNIEFEVDYHDSTWSKDTSAEIDEQIERIMSNGFYNKISGKNILSPLFSFLTPIFIMYSVYTLLSFFFKPIPSTNEVISKYYNGVITSQEIDTLQKLLQRNNSLEDKINFLYKKDSIILSPKVTSVNVQPSQSPSNLSFLKDYHFYMISLPIIFIMVLFYYLYKYCYPRYVFEWGDYAVYYQKLVERRKLIWNLLLGSIFLGVVINLFSFGITDLFSKK